MNMTSGVLQRWRFAGIGLLACALSGCMGGTGTDTENGIVVTARVVNASGTPAQGVEVTVLPANARGDSLGENPLVNPNTPLVTDSNGYIYVILKSPGVYVAEGRRADTALFIDSLRTQQGTASTVGFSNGQVFVVEPSLRAIGKIRMLSGFRADSGRVFLRGTKLQSPVGMDGSYDLAWLPLSAETMTITVVYSSKPSATRYVRVAEQGGSLVVFAPSGATRCLTDSATATIPVDTIPGSLASPSDVAGLVGNACAGTTTGTLVQVLKSDASGKTLEIAGSYVIPEVDALVPAGRAVSTACVMPEKGATGRGVLKLVAGEIVVDDLRRTANCP
jgi:hypothetical protein